MIVMVTSILKDMHFLKSHSFQDGIKCTCGPCTGVRIAGKRRRLAVKSAGNGFKELMSSCCEVADTVDHKRTTALRKLHPCASVREMLVLLFFKGTNSEQLRV
jgi:hypothetical protein